MAKGALSKEIVFNKLLEVFPGSFMYNDNKELRVNLQEDGGLCQIKVALTCAKTPVESGQDVAVPGVQKSLVSSGEFDFPDPVGDNKPVTAEVQSVEATDQEKQDIAKMIAELGL